MIPYSPLEGGFLTGKYRRGEPVPQSARASGIERRFLNDRGFTILEALEKLGQARGKSIAQMALAWQLTQPVITSPIIGANSIEQLNDSLGAVGLRLSEEEMKALDAASAWEQEECQIRCQVSGPNPFLKACVV